MWHKRKNQSHRSGGVPIRVSKETLLPLNVHWCTMAPSCASCPNGPWRCSTRQSVRGFARCRNASGLCRAASSVSARLQNVVLLASKAAWQLARVNRSVSLASASRHTLPRRARAACRCRECAATQGSPKTFVVKEAERNLGDGGGHGVIFFEGANKLVLIEAAIGRRPCPPQHRPFLNINVNICNMHVESCNMHVDV